MPNEKKKKESILVSSPTLGTTLGTQQGSALSPVYFHVLHKAVQESIAASVEESK